MDISTEVIIERVIASLVSSSIVAGGKMVRKVLKGSPRYHAVERCIKAGLMAMLPVDGRFEQEDHALLQEIFSNFFSLEETAKELAGLLRGKDLNLVNLHKHFEMAGYDRMTLPGINFDEAIRRFGKAFLFTAEGEGELQALITTSHIRQGSKVQQEILDRLKPSYLEIDYLQTLIDECEVVPLSLIYETPNNQQELPEVKICDIFSPLYLEFQDSAVRDDFVWAISNDSKARAEERKEIHSLTGNHKAPISAYLSPFHAVQTVAVKSRLVILGQGGGGKSALINHLVVQLATKRLKGTFDKQDKMPGWYDQDKRHLPVRIILSEFAAWSQSAEKAPKEADYIWNYLKYQCKDYYPSLKEELINNGGVVFFDGLDEVTVGDTRSDVEKYISGFANSKSLEKCKILITCREYAYREITGKNNKSPLGQFSVATLTPVVRKDIEAFIDNWYRIIGPAKRWARAKVRREVEKLADKIKNEAHLEKLAENPLLLTLIINLYAQQESLPENRAELYRRMIKLRLDDWESFNKRNANKESFSGFNKFEKLKLPFETLKSMLAKLAFAAHEQLEEQKNHEEREGNISWHDIKELWKDKLAHDYEVQIVIDYILDRSALLRRVDNNYSFIHYSLQEYLAAVYIRQDPKFVDKISDCLVKNLSWWREVFLLVANISGESTPRNIVSLVDALLPEPEESYVNAENIKRAVLISEALQENKWDDTLEKKYPWAYERTLKNVQTWLLHGLKAEKKLPLAERITAGVSLARLGDSRKEIITFEHMPFCYVPAGAYFRGSLENMRHAPDIEKLDPYPSIDKAYWISRYPVSQAQFQQFVDDGGYRKRSYWVDQESTHGIETEEWKNGKYNGRNTPEKFGAPFDLSNHPVVGVSWYEAVAFTRWLTEEWLKAKGNNKDIKILQPGYRVRLPTESEWEKAARGGKEIPELPVIMQINQIRPDTHCLLKENLNPQRMYPWNDKEADPGSVNVKELNTTSPLGCFLHTASPYGCQEMCINVSEWSLDKARMKYDPNKTTAHRMVIGDKWKEPASFYEIACRIEYAPDVPNKYLGFRLVIEGP